MKIDPYRMERAPYYAAFGERSHRPPWYVVTTPPILAAERVLALASLEHHVASRYLVCDSLAPTGGELALRFGHLFLADENLAFDSDRARAALLMLCAEDDPQCDRFAWCRIRKTVVKLDSGGVWQRLAPFDWRGKPIVGAQWSLLG